MQHPQGRADLCKADLRGAQLNGADLTYAQLNGADLTYAELNGATLAYARLNGANLGYAQLNEDDLTGAQLNGADLRFAQLNGASLIFAQLNEANLGYAQLSKAHLLWPNIKNATLAYANLAGAIYAPAPSPPATNVAGIRGLEAVTFPPGNEIGLVQLRKLLQDGGLRDLERQATYAIEHGNTQHIIENWKEEPTHAAEGIFRFVAFDLTTAYGLHPGRALLFLMGSIGVFGVIYTVVLMRTAGSIYRIWPQGRLEREFGVGKLIKEAEVELLLPWGFPAAFGRGLQFSLLSAFNLGWRELNVGTWIARLQTREYTLQAIGWVRVVSGAQSLLSVYLLAIWALTYFGRPFQ